MGKGGRGKGKGGAGGGGPAPDVAGWKGGGVSPFGGCGNGFGGFGWPDPLMFNPWAMPPPPFWGWMPPTAGPVGACYGGYGGYPANNGFPSKGRGKGKKAGKDGKGKGKGKMADGKSRGKGKKHGDGADHVGRRKSVLSTTSFSEVGTSYAKFGGKLLTIPTDSELLGELECVKLEPAGKTLAPTKYVSTGVVFCLQGLPPGTQSMQEWCAATEAARWLEMGVTVMIPNMQMSSAMQASDIAAVVDAGLKVLDYDRCILVCKDMVAHRAVEMASQNLLANGNVTGLVLIAPSSPPPDACRELGIPVLVLWAANDDVIPIEECESWMEALLDRDGPTTMKECADGHHQLDVMLQDRNIAEALHSFTVSAFLIADLGEELVKTESNHGQGDAAPDAKAVERINRLTVELPHFLQEAVNHHHLGESPVASNGKRETPEAVRQRRLSQDISMFVASGFVHDSE